MLARPMPIELHERQAFIRACDPGEPLRAGDPAYVELDHGTPVRGGHGLSCIDELERTILFSNPAEPTCQLFTGFPGTGKTTELRILCDRLNRNKQLPTHAVLVDVESFINIFQPISIADVLRILAYVLDREATVNEGGDLEKLTPLNEEGRALVEASVETVFVQHAAWLRLPCHSIYTYPMWLRFRTAVLGPLYDQEPPTLPMVKIAEPEGHPYAPGVAKLVELVGRRIDVGRVFGQPPDATLGEIIRASGGYLRDLLRMVRDILFQASSFPVSPEICRQTIDRVAEAYARVIREPEIDLLVEIARTHTIPVGDDQRLAAFGAVLKNWLVLVYRNGSEWYDLHPLVKRARAVSERLSRPDRETVGRVGKPRTGVVHIRRIHIENLRSFDAITLDDIPAGETDEGQCVLIVGANGTGKTTLLRAIAVALLDAQSSGAGLDSLVEPLSLLQDPSKPGIAEVTLGDDVYRVELVPDAGRLRVRPAGGALPRPWLVAYGCWRGSFLRGSPSATAPAGDTATLWSEVMGLWPSLQWLQDLAKRVRAGDGEASLVLEEARSVLKAALYDIDEVSAESERVWVHGAALGGKIHAAALSDGYLGTMGWVLDLVARWEARMRALGNPAEARFTQQMEGIALIDDIDSHLHPLWQRQLLPNLRKAFPRMTFVGTTHNPQTLIGARKGEKIQVLRRSWEPPRRVEAHAFHVPEGLRADQVLTGGWFGLDSSLDDNTIALLDQHQALLLAGRTQADAQVQAIAEELRGRLGRFVSTSRESYVYGIVSEILAEQFPKLSPEQREHARQRLKELAKAKLKEREEVA
jgi:energy-coupling factor transporter ATP-binding protein EcfA2